MKQKRILILFPSALVPAIMMSQKRTIEQILALKKDHQVGVLCICRTAEEAIESEEFFKLHNLRFHQVLSAPKSKLLHTLLSLWYLFKFYFFAQRIEYQKNASSNVTRKILQIIECNYDIVISHFWFGSAFMKQLNNTIKMIDAHGLVEEFIELNDNQQFLTNRPKHERRVLKNNLKYQKNIHQNSDYLILNSIKSFNIARQNYPGIKTYYCPNGQNLNYFFSFPKTSYEQDTILFYGSYSGTQNIIALELFYKNVWRIIVQENPMAKLLVVGNKPPQWIRDLSKNNNIEVTGFVEDVRAQIQRAACMVIPMTVGVGFRGRIVEVMAMGVPIIGNHNALDCIGLDHGINGYVTDDYNTMADEALKLMSDQQYRTIISNNTLEFVSKNYSIEATFGKLSVMIEEF